MNARRHWVLLPAAGNGSRMAADRPKQYLELAGKPVLAHTLNRLLAEPRIDGITIVLAPEDSWFEQFSWPQDARIHVARVGGEDRASTVRNGLQQLKVHDDDWVLVHDAARCCLPLSALCRLLDTLQDDPVGGLLALPVTDTVKRADAGGRVQETVPRNGLWLAQTPQMFRAELLRRALAPSVLKVTDEASAVELLGLSPCLVLGDSLNFKLTWPHDLEQARGLYGVGA